MSSVVVIVMMIVVIIVVMVMIVVVMKIVVFVVVISSLFLHLPLFSLSFHPPPLPQPQVRGGEGVADADQMPGKC